MNKEANKQLLVICYPNQWHWVLSLEYLHQQQVSGLEIDVLDLSLCGESRDFETAKKSLSFMKFRIGCRNWLKDNDTRYFQTRLIRRDRPRIDFEANPILSQDDFGPAFNSIVEHSGELLVNSLPNRKLITREFMAMNSVNAALEKIQIENYDTVVTVNGRFTKNATVAMWAKNGSKKLLLLEFGSTQEKFDVFEISPHSMREIQTKIERFWNQYEVNKHQVLPSDLMKKFVKTITERNIWRSKMLDGHAPSKTTKKRCVFFASTEAEYAGVGDEVEAGNYRNQVEGFRGLLSALDSKEWEIYLRRHPKHPSVENGDPEQHLWQEFENTVGVCIVPPESEVDSIELARGADLNVNFCSTIAMELIAIGITNVITMGPAPWNNLIPSRYCPNASLLQAFLLKQPDQLNEASILPWVTYINTFGESFKLFDFDSKRSSWHMR
jgi:hypothetical protein